MSEEDEMPYFPLMLLMLRAMILIIDISFAFRYAAADFTCRVYAIMLASSCA